ncbi:ZYBA0S03-06414g1_1 [Zygosaccharomyces bailii CLIB 213]|uniref:Kinetochore protein Spc24 n=1 Tax=Zygosaccharomyces bailii (strain CLIB 213 / ATCC 58445 / CBS 680 / BCRC 21525 / NBRC 1098 / NCYC 1416 / NRRL Y-2227) TaxID=1333698 RepID=A0A8J2T631_ZYGB2|nr:ZYBA0S03-06414g1_1 [Zygosaccharomyces bailii CLIB 213]
MANNELLENPAELLREVRENFMIQQDVDSIANIDDKINQIHSKSLAKLKAKNIDVQSLHSQYEKERKLVDELSLESDKFRQESQELASQRQVVDYVKELDELEQSIVLMRGQLDEKIIQLVRDSRDQKKKEFPEESMILSDPIAKANILKLKLYRSMGVVVDEEKGQVLIKGNENEVNILPIDNDFSDFFKTKFIWEKISK